MKWTRDLPPGHGYYWYAPQLGGPLEVVHVWLSERGLRVTLSGCGGSYPLMNFHGQWYGPIPEPEDHHDPP